ncbi:MAG: flavodoxin [Clostridia bacterium]|nr:flavodoxin [Clostridia bacterium]MBR4577760.1 flavodoxin [Clostridia bacterium]
MRALVAYFSASGVTAGVAKKLSDEIKAELYEIRPALAYSQDDLDWRNGQSRSSIEMQNKSCRPKLSDLDAPVAKADIIFIGYPVWWYREPSIIDSFLDAYDFTGKKIVLFATSGSSDIGEEAPKRVAEISGTSVLAAKRFPANVDASELKAWAEGF